MRFQRLCCANDTPLRFDGAGSLNINLQGLRFFIRGLSDILDVSSVASMAPSRIRTQLIPQYLWRDNASASFTTAELAAARSFWATSV